MEITIEQFALIERYLPRQRGNVRLANIDVINAILWLEEHDCKWLALPPRFGHWHTAYVRINRWTKAGVIDRVFEQMQRLGILELRLEAVPSVAMGNGAVHNVPGSVPALDLDAVSVLKFTWVPRLVDRAASS